MQQKKQEKNPSANPLASPGLMSRCSSWNMKSCMNLLMSWLLSMCLSFRFDLFSLQAIQSFLCKNCEYKQHQCFACGKLGPSDKSINAEVRLPDCGSYFPFRKSVMKCSYIYLIIYLSNSSFLLLFILYAVHPSSHSYCPYPLYLHKLHTEIYIYVHVAATLLFK